MAGAALVLGSEPEQEPNLQTSYATLDLGTHPTNVVEAINVGDSYSPGGDSKLTITDLYVTPEGNEQRVMGRVKLQGQQGNELVSFDGAPPRLGRQLTIATDLYSINGRIQAVGDQNSLPKSNATVIISDVLPNEEVKALAEGDRITSAGRTVATVEEITQFPHDERHQRVYLATTLRTYTLQGSQYFGQTPIQQGQTLRLPAEDYTITGTIQQVGGELETEAVDVLLHQTLDVQTVEQIDTGDVIQAGSKPRATIETITTYATGNPDRKDVYLGVGLDTLHFDERNYFSGTEVRDGNSLLITTDEYSFTARIQQVDALEQRGTETTKTVTLRKTDVYAPMAESLDPGMAEESGDKTIGEITNVDIEPAIVLIRGDDGNLGVYDHPTKRNLRVTADLTVRETTNGIQFKGETIQQGSDVTLDLGTRTLRATVITIE